MDIKKLLISFFHISMDEYDNKRIKESIDNSNDNMLDKFDFRLIRDFAQFANTNEKEIQTILDNRNP